MQSEIELIIYWLKWYSPNKYYKSRAVGVTSEVGLTTDWDLSVLACLRTRHLLYLHDTGIHVVRATIQQIDCRINQLHLCRAEGLPQQMSWHDTKQSDGEAPIMFELYRMWSATSLRLLPGPLQLGVVAPDWVLSMGQIELFDYLNWV